jgi:septal ring factor EnvC (AmiA/AmiB activator)
MQPVAQLPVAPQPAQVNIEDRNDLVRNAIQYQGHDCVVIRREDFNELLDTTRNLRTLVNVLLAQNTQLQQQNAALVAQNTLLTKSIDRMDQKQKNLEKDIKSLQKTTKILTGVAIGAGVVAVVAGGAVALPLLLA